MGHGRNIAGTRPPAITRRFELCDERGLVELRDGAEHLAHQDRGRRVLDVGARIRAARLEAGKSSASPSSKYRSTRRVRTDFRGQTA